MSCRQGRTSRRASATPAAVHDAVRGPGHPLDAAARTFFEPRFGRDFSAVRVHTGSRAAASAASLDARAYTVGAEIVFGAGEYEPHTQRGTELLAHELTHVVQQSGAQGSLAAESLRTSTPAGSYEREAREAASSVAAGREPRIEQHASQPMLSRWEYCDTTMCPPRERGELTRADAKRLQFGQLPTPTNSIVYPFDIGSADTSSLRGNPHWRTFRDSLRGGTDAWDILGFTDCQGEEGLNAALRRQRADNVFALLPAASQAHIGQHVAAGDEECVASNETEEGRALNRSAVFQLVKSEIDVKEAETVDARSCPPVSSAPVSTIEDYVFLLMCAERQMGLPPREMLAMFRQLYYGPSWSGSVNPMWAKVIPCSPNIGDPAAKLGTNLFKALRMSRSVSGTHVGHVFAGLEAMTCPARQVDLHPLISPVAMSNEEFATWGGDLGAAVAAYVACPQLGSDAASSDDCGRTPGRQPLEFYLGVHAPPNELEGDIDAFVMRAQALGFVCSGSAMQTFAPNRKISELFQEYYVTTQGIAGATYTNRYQCALEAMGATVSHGNVTNRAPLTASIGRRVASFADPFFTKISMTGSSSWLRAAWEMSDVGDRTRMRLAAPRAVDYFLDWLKP